MARKQACLGLAAQVPQGSGAGLGASLKRDMRLLYLATLMWGGPGLPAMGL